MGTKTEEMGVPHKAEKSWWPFPKTFTTVLLTLVSVGLIVAFVWLVSVLAIDYHEKERAEEKSLEQSIHLTYESLITEMKTKHKESLSALKTDHGQALDRLNTEYQESLDALKKTLGGPENVIRVEQGATIMTKVWFAKDMEGPIIKQMLVTEGVCATSKEANDQAMEAIKKAASQIHIECKKIDELQQ